MKIYQVGGSVRDKLMQKTPHDTDYVVTGASVEQMQQLGYRQVGKHFPVFIEPSSGDEYALARKEIKIGPKHTDFKFIFDSSITLADDLERRDFTCNAIALDKDNGEIIDYHHGQKDIENKILRHVNSQHFPEDPLRVLRMCRFAAQLDFTPADETMQLASDMVRQGMLESLTVERVWQEILRALQSRRFDKFILTARQCGALAVILPEVNKLFDIPERTDYHPEGNSGSHTLLCLQQIPDANTKTKFAVLLHDIGKIKTPRAVLPSHPQHGDTGTDIIKNICIRLKIPTEFKNFAVLCCRYHMKLHLIRQIKLPALVDLIDKITKVSSTSLQDFLTLCRADFFGRQREIPASEQQNFFKDVQFLQKTAQILQKIKATDMPDFSKIPKDKSFFLKYREFKIDVLRQSLDDKNNSKEN